MSLFYRDSKKKIEKSWDDLLFDLGGINSFSTILDSPDPYVTFKNIIISLIIGEEIVILDSDFSSEELNKISDSYLANKKTIDIFIDKDLFKNKKSLLKAIRSKTESWSISLFSSGTTGLPKKIVHSFTSITRNVKVYDSYEIRLWGFAYNFAHMAGVQVFFQALLNCDSIIMLYGLPNDRLLTQFQDNDITHVSATPTFYNLLFPCEHIFESVIRLTSGGEKFNKSTVDRLKKVFVNAKIRNVYASTEAGALFASENDLFVIKEEYNSLIKVVDNELFIHETLLGDKNLAVDSWYKSGDLVDVIEKEPLKIRFISRKGEILNIGGYNVNLLEIEDVISLYKGVESVCVFSKKNVILGNIICCEIVSTAFDISELEIRIFLKERLQEYKIPRMIKFVNELTTTRSGKLKRLR